MNTVSIFGFDQSDTEELWLDVRSRNWQRVLDWAMRFAEFSGKLNGTRHNGVKAEGLILLLNYR
jgi:hypothetical protein